MQELNEVTEIINQIGSTSRRTEKESILSKNKDNELLKTIFRFVYDSMITTGISKRKLDNPLAVSEIDLEIDTLESLMDYLKENNTGRHKDVCVAKSFLEKYDGEELKLIRSIILKDLPIGISRTTLNKVYGKDFIQKYSVMLAGKYDREKTKIDDSFTISLKLDGNRITVFNKENGPQFFARSGKEITGLVELEKEFRRLPIGMVYDGEVSAINHDGLDSKDLFNLTQTIVRRKGEKTGLELIMFDMLPIEEFNSGKSKKVFSERMEDMNKLFKTIQYQGFIKKVPHYYTGKDVEAIDHFLDIVMAEGEEGLMINFSNAHYETKRSKGILKVKEFHTADLRCVGVKEDIRGGKCGSITVLYKGYKVDVSGLKDKDKISFWENPDLVVGKLIEVKYKDESSNALGGLSLRHPNFLRIRDDKDEVSYA